MVEISKTSFAGRLNELRTNRNLTQIELALLLKINKSSISRYEKGQQIPEIEVLKKISKYFEVTIDYLLGLTDINHYESEYGDCYYPIVVEDDNIYMPEYKPLDNLREFLKLHSDHMITNDVYEYEEPKNETVANLINQLNKCDNRALKTIETLTLSLLNNYEQED